MADQYRLIFRGEVREGQHAAVVKKRLQTLLKLDDDRATKLFGGKPVVLKKSVDEQTAARFQAAFKKAGAVLRVAPLSEAGEPAAPAASSADGDWTVLPPGSDILSESERPDAPEQDIDTSHIKMQGAVFTTPEEPEELLGPDVSHLDLADLGSRLGPEGEEEPQQALDVNFDLAEIGADLGQVRSEAQLPPAPDVDFGLAEPGARIGPEAAEAAPEAPDTSHIQLQTD